MKNTNDIATTTVTVWVHCLVDIDGMAWRAHGPVCAEMRTLDDEQAPVVATWEGEQYRTFDGELWAVKTYRLDSTRAKLSVDLIRYCSFETDLAVPNESLEQRMMEPGLNVDTNERAKRSEQFQEALEAKRNAVEAAVIVDGMVWERTDGPKLVVGHVSSDRGLVSFEFRSAEHRPVVHETYARRTFSAFDADRVMASYAESFEIVRTVGERPVVVTEEGWSLPAIQDRLHRGIVEAIALAMRVQMREIKLTDAPRAMLEAHAALKTAVEENAATEEIFRATREMLRLAPPGLKKNSNKCLMAALEAADHAAVPAPELDAFSLP